MTATIDSEAQPYPPLDSGRILFLAVAAAAATSTSYTVQPELGRIAGDLGASLAATSAAAGLPILGYMLGLGLLVPLVDRLPARGLISAHLAILAGALVLASLATDVYLFGAGLFVSGICASTGAQMSTLAGKYSPADRRGRALGTITAGISAGVLLGRMVGGALADAFGWRAMLIVVACACLACAFAARALLPRTIPQAPESYLVELISMPGLLRTYPSLGVAAFSGALWFFAFSLIWVSLSLALAMPPLNLPPTIVGLYSLAGLAGIAATRIAGQMADEFGSRPVVLAALGLALVCTLTMIPGLGVAPLLLIALALFDAGLFGAQVANQRGVLNLAPLRPARLNSTYMVIYFIGGSAGTVAGGPIVSILGWPAAACTAVLAIIAAMVVCLVGRRADRSAAGAPSASRRHPPGPAAPFRLSGQAAEECREPESGSR